MTLGAHRLVSFDCNKPKIVPYYNWVAKNGENNQQYLPGGEPSRTSDRVTVNASVCQDNSNAGKDISDHHWRLLHSAIATQVSGKC